MPRVVRLLVFGGLAVLLAGGGVAWLARGPAILLDLASGASRLLCL
jgi:hypothetical protein